MNKFTWIVCLLFTSRIVLGQDDFNQLGTILPTPNEYRTASGAPAHAYWHQKVDYKIKVELDDEKQRIYGEEVITYHNNSPDVLSYLWLQLDQNASAVDADKHALEESSIPEKMSIDALSALEPTFDGGHKITHVNDNNGNSLKYIVNKTMMRVDLPQGLRSGEKFSFNVKWWYNINDRMKIGGRSGYEYFAKDGNYLYTIAQFFPRLCAYKDAYGWQNKQFLGRGEFTLEFGDYEVEIKVPSDHLVAATGELRNEKEILTADQLARLSLARKEFSQPVIIANQKEAIKREGGKSKSIKTWKFIATNVRDFAFASSRKFIWDAMAHKSGDNTVMAMSMYPKEGNPLWEKYSTKAVAHTLKWYSNYTFDYPYPVAWSINADRIGMEYPMICFNFGRCEEDGTYTERAKYGMIGVIIHEVGHNYFPMIVNSDERQWSWMDEGLNTYLQYLTEQQWERNYPTRRGPAHKIVDYMKGDKSNISPIMSNSENVFQFGNNAYAKPATALNILRETVVGRDLFDSAFKEYANRWKFKSPEPADFFRTIEDASAVDLDWFWKAWFYGTDHVDLSLSEVKHFVANPLDPDKKYEIVTNVKNQEPEHIGDIRNKKDIVKTYSEIDPSIIDFYSTYDESKPTGQDRENYKKSLQGMSNEEIRAINGIKHYYEVVYENVGGNPMPVIILVRYADGTTEEIRYPAEIWRFDNKTFKKVIVSDKVIDEIILDPFLETADVDRDNNYFPKRSTPSRFEVFKSNERPQGENPMQKAKRSKEIKP